MSIAKQGISYFIVGLIQLLADWLVFILLSFFAVPVIVANIVGRMIGALLGFWLNGKVTFRASTEGNLDKTYLLRFVMLWMVTAAISTLAVGVADAFNGLYLAWLVKPMVDGILALCGFLVSRHWVYKKKT